MSAAAVTVPCKYKTGKTLGQGTYAVVKGASVYPPVERFPGRTLLAGHVIQGKCTL